MIYLRDVKYRYLDNFSTALFRHSKKFHNSFLLGIIWISARSLVGPGKQHLRCPVGTVRGCSRNFVSAKKRGPAAGPAVLSRRARAQGGAAAGPAVLSRRVLPCPSAPCRAARALAGPRQSSGNQVFLKKH